MKISSGARRKCNRSTSSRRTKPEAACRPSIVAAAAVSSPCTTTITRAERESGARRTSLTLARPMRGSPSSPSRIVSISSRRASLSRSRWYFWPRRSNESLPSKTDENIRSCAAPGRDDWSSGMQAFTKIPRTNRSGPRRRCLRYASQSALRFSSAHRDSRANRRR